VLHEWLPQMWSSFIMFIKQCRVSDVMQSWILHVTFCVASDFL
jgi:hypothetical protein